MSQILALRHQRTLDFLARRLPAPATILDLGPPNPFADQMRAQGYEVVNTPEGVDLDLHPEVAAIEADAVTAFEILEHLVAPFNVLRAMNAPRLLASIPMRLWFASAYRNDNDPWDRHFHEFEDWQFDWLLEKAGWTIEHREQWNSPINQIGLRPLLRRFTPRYYIVDAVRPKLSESSR
ncbi:MAG: methyltransferase [Bacteroidota bacterium]